MLETVLEAGWRLLGDDLATCSNLLKAFWKSAEGTGLEAQMTWGLRSLHRGPAWPATAEARGCYSPARPKLQGGVRDRLAAPGSIPEGGMKMASRVRSEQDVFGLVCDWYNRYLGRRAQGENDDIGIA